MVSLEELRFVLQRVTSGTNRNLRNQGVKTFFILSVYRIFAMLYYVSRAKSHRPALYFFGELLFLIFVFNRPTLAESRLRNHFIAFNLVSMINSNTLRIAVRPGSLIISEICVE